MDSTGQVESVYFPQVSPLKPEIALIFPDLAQNKWECYT